MWKHSLACLGREPFHVYLTYQKQGWIDPHLRDGPNIHDDISTYDPWWKSAVTPVNTHTKIPWKEFRNDPSVLQCITRHLLYLFQRDINQTCEKSQMVMNWFRIYYIMIQWKSPPIPIVWSSISNESKLGLHIAKWLPWFQYVQPSFICPSMICENGFIHWIPFSFHCHSTNDWLQYTAPNAHWTWCLAMICIYWIYNHEEKKNADPIHFVTDVLNITSVDEWQDNIYTWIHDTPYSIDKWECTLDNWILCLIHQHSFEKHPWFVKFVSEHIEHEKFISQDTSIDKIKQYETKYQLHLLEEEEEEKKDPLSCEIIACQISNWISTTTSTDQSKSVDITHKVWFDPALYLLMQIWCDKQTNK